MYRVVPIASFRAAGVLAGLALVQTAQAAPSVLPGAVSGWHQVGATRTYNSRNLFDLIDGGAQAVMEYGFISCVHAEYAPPRQNRPALTVDAYQMTDPLNSFGMFSSSDRQSGTPVAVGAEGVKIGATGLNFWKGSYVVRAAILQPSPANQAALLAYAKATAAKIPGGGGMPPLIRALPAGRQPRSEGYQRANVAGQSFLTNAVRARYPAHGQGAEVFIAQYPNPAGAKAAFTAYSKFEAKNPGLAPVKGLGSQAFAVNDRYAKSVVAALKGRYIVGAHHFRDPKAAMALVKQTVGKVK